ncbi:uncharacterized protein LOC112688202 isoform X2 [Sipha flava]|nr:uncharacterized protein LOC112688202 isoform X2 [Sipha flava]
MNNQPKVLEHLLKTVKAFKNDTQNKLGRTALNIAASQGASECIDILLNNLHCDINSTDKNFKNTPLHWCITSKCIEGVKLLLNHGADLKLVNKFGKSPIQLAKTTCLNIFHFINEFVKDKNKDYYLHSTSETNSTGKLKNNTYLGSSSSTSQFKTTSESSKLGSKIYAESINQLNINSNDSTLEPDLTSNNSNESFFLDMSKLKDGDNSVLNLLEKSIEPVDETSFVSSILNSGKVIQLTEAGILALEYTKNEVNTPIPDSLVKSFLNTSQQYNDNDTNKKSKNEDSKTPIKGLKRMKSPQPCSKKIKYTETPIDKNSEFESLLEQLSSKYTNTVPKANNSNVCGSQNVSSVESNVMKNNEVYTENQLVCLNSDINTQPKWVEDLMCLLHKLDNPDTADN